MTDAPKMLYLLPCLLLGVVLTYAQDVDNICHSVMKSSLSEGRLISPDYPDDYPPSIKCQCNVTAASSATLIYVLEELEIEPYPGCGYDSLEVKAAFNTVHCGNKSGEFNTGSHKATFTFSSDQDIVEKGFKLRYYALAPDDTTVPVSLQCDGPQAISSSGSGDYAYDYYFSTTDGPPVTDVTTEGLDYDVTVPGPLGDDVCSEIANPSVTEGWLRSPNYPRPYRPDKTCHCRLTTDPSATLYYDLKDIDIEHEASCTYDFLSVATNDFCGNTQQGTYSIGRPVAAITFRADGLVEGRGFRLRYYALDSDNSTALVSLQCGADVAYNGTATDTAAPEYGRYDICGGHFTDQPSPMHDAAYLHSPNFPNKYPINVDCTCKVIADVCAYIHLEIEFMLLEKEGKTCYDYLLASPEGRQKPTQFCGKIQTSKKVFDSGTVAFKFSSDYSVTRKGFIAKYYATAQDDSPTPVSLQCEAQNIKEAGSGDYDYVTWWPSTVEPTQQTTAVDEEKLQEEYLDSRRQECIERFEPPDKTTRKPKTEAPLDFGPILFEQASDENFKYIVSGASIGGVVIIAVLVVGGVLLALKIWRHRNPLPPDADPDGDLKDANEYNPGTGFTENSANALRRNTHQSLQGCESLTFASNLNQNVYVTLESGEGAQPDAQNHPPSYDEAVA